MTLYIGYDNGKQGAIVGINQDREIEIKLTMGDVNWLADVFINIKKNYSKVIVGIEKAHAMPGQGTVSMFNYGVSFGQIQGILAALKIPYTLIPPQTWSKKMHVGAKGATSKEKSLEVVRRLFPTVDLKDPGAPRAKLPHKGIIDALIIAEYVRLSHK
jgi:hypothetical protein